MKTKIRQSLVLTDEYFKNEAIEFIQTNEPEEGYFVGFSGGKDSIVTYDLVKKSGVKHFPFYSCTGIDPPSVVHFIKQNYPEITFIKPKEDFYAGIIRRGLPTIFKRWCCQALKETTIKVNPLKHRIMGIRAEESIKRAGKPRISPFKSKKILHYKPIFYWNEYHVWNYIEQNNLKYPSLYDEGFNRIGCVVCPFINYKQKMINKKLYPGIYRASEIAAKQHFVLKHKDKYADETFEEWLQYWYEHSYFKNWEELNKDFVRKW